VGLLRAPRCLTAVPVGFHPTWSRCPGFSVFSSSESFICAKLPGGIVMGKKRGFNPNNPFTGAWWGCGCGPWDIVSIDLGAFSWFPHVRRVSQVLQPTSCQSGHHSTRGPPPEIMWTGVQGGNGQLLQSGGGTGFGFVSLFPPGDRFSDNHRILPGLGRRWDKSGFPRNTGPVGLLRCTKEVGRGCPFSFAGGLAPF